MDNEAPKSACLAEGLTGHINEVTEGSSSGKSNSRCIVLEVFSGSCRLSKACRGLGLEAVAIDHTSQRSENFPIFHADLTNESDLKRVIEYIDVEAENLLHAHFAPACGTASRARGRPIPGEDPAKGPQPLRSETHPNGLPDLSSSQHERVDKANSCYEATAILVRHLINLGVSVSIENPKNSFFWLCTPIQRLLEDFKHLHFSYFDHCMHGGKRDKRTAWWSWNPRRPSDDLFSSLQLVCNKAHGHAPWRPYKDAKGQTVFPTAEEAAYPYLLCERIASILKSEAELCGFVFIDDLHAQLNEFGNAAARQLFTSQPRGHKLRPLVSEYGHYVPFLTMVDDENAISQFLADLPKGAKVCHRKFFPGGVLRDDMLRKHTSLQFSDSWTEQCPCELLQIGVPREPADFLREAIEKGHPRDIIAQVPNLVRPALESLVKGNVAERFRARANFMKKWLRRSLELREEEKTLHDRLPDHLKKILAGKRLLLWKEILVDLEYPDASVVDDMISGFALTGWAPTTGVFRSDVRRPSLSVKQLVNMAPGLNASVLESILRTEPGEHDQLVWDETLSEVERGWLAESDASGECFIARRFPVPQKSKVRLVDDFSVAGVNAAFGLREKLRVQAVDELCAYLACMMDGSSSDGPPILVGRTYDLRSAYKQFGTDPWHADHLRIAVKKPSGGYGVFRALALPFGASGSVVHFLRISASLTFIGVAALLLVWTSFFDDFTCLCGSEEERNVSFYIESLFRLLGVDFADSGDKAVPFTPRFKTLGILFDVSGLQDGRFTLEHTEKRRDELSETLQCLIGRGSATPKELERLHGRLIWYGSFIYGRMLNRLVKEVSNMSRKRGKLLQFDPEFMEVLRSLNGAVQDSKPVPIGRSLCHTWIIFTDGAYEPGNPQPATFGAVLVSPSGTPVEMFGEPAPTTLLDDFLRESQHPIYEMEVLPVVLACKIWTKYIAGSPTVFYLDNTAARSACIKGDGANRATRLMLFEFVKLESRFRILSWFGRVPSHSNLADAPSRLCFSDHLLQACRRISVVAPSHLEQWG